MQFDFTEILLKWYYKNQRDLPWRKNTDPYRIWISEIILQQTRVAQGLDYFNRFVLKFPSILDLAKAKEEDVLKQWQGLGYYSRARNLHFTAKHIVNNLNGVFPNSYESLLTLKGIGSYTAAAISSISFNEPKAVVDGNVMRVLSRVIGIADDLSSSKSKKTFESAAQNLISTENPGDYNQAIMEFGALQCVPQNPNCEICPLNQNCFAYQKNQIDQLPVKTKTLKKKKRYLDFLVIKQDDSFYLSKRQENDIYKGLYTFPFIENRNKLAKDEICNSIHSLLESNSYSFSKKAYTKHILSHQLLFYRFHFVQVGDWDYQANNQIKVSKNELADLPIPKILEATIDLLTKDIDNSLFN